MLKKPSIAAALLLPVFVAACAETDNTPRVNTNAARPSLNQGAWDFVILSANFNGGSVNNFAYADNAFGGNGGAYVSGAHNPADGVNGLGCLQVSFNGLDNADVGLMSGAFSRTFSMQDSAQDVIKLSFDYRVMRAGTYESNEDAMVYVQFDNTIYGQGGNPYITRLESSGNGAQADTGWRHVEMELRTTTMGRHTLSLGGVLEGKDAVNENGTICIDNVLIEGRDDDGGEPNRSTPNTPDTEGPSDEPRDNPDQPGDGDDDTRDDDRDGGPGQNRDNPQAPAPDSGTPSPRDNNQDTRDEERSGGPGQDRAQLQIPVLNNRAPAPRGFA